LKRLLAIFGFVFSLAFPLKSYAGSGDCTAWAYEMRPDLYGSVWGNAGGWAIDARMSGRSVGFLPKVGAIAVWRPWTGGAWGQGHVAYVTSVGAYGFTVTEMHYPVYGRVTSRWVPRYSGAMFIYK